MENRKCTQNVGGEISWKDVWKTKRELEVGFQKCSCLRGMHELTDSSGEYICSLSITALKYNKHMCKVQMAN
jgi:hypothetical protein